MTWTSSSKDACRDPYVDGIRSNCRIANKFIKARNSTSEVLKAKQADTPLKLALPSATRFTSRLIVMARFKRVLLDL